MNKTLKKIFLMTFIFSLFVSSFSPIAKAEEIDEKEVDELAEQLKFIYEEATIKDRNGNIINLDIKMIEEKYGSSPELDELKSENKITLINKNNPSITPMNAKLDRCIEKKIKNGLGDVLSLAAITTVIEYIKDGEYTLAAKKLIKLGVKGNAVGITAQLILWWGQCNLSENGW